MPVDLPAGVIPDLSPTGMDALIGHRRARYRYDLRDRHGAPRGALLGVQTSGPSITESSASTLKRGGSLPLVEVGQEIDWLTARIAISYEVDGYGSWGVGVFVPSSPDEDWDGPNVRRTVELLDAAHAFRRDPLTATLALPAGTNILDTVKDVIEETGADAGSLTASSKTLAGARVYRAGTDRLEVINELLDCAAYFSLFTDGDGRPRAEPYVLPAARPIRWEFIDGATCIYRPKLSRTRDLLNVPNRVIARTPGEGATEGLVAIADNVNPDSPWSQPARGEIVAVTLDVNDAADEDALQVIANRALVNATTPTSTVVIDAMPVPVNVNDAVRFRRGPMNVDSRHVVTKIEWPRKPTELARYTLREVVDV